jgi:anthranilate phosphoribosyltransferase
MQGVFHPPYIALQIEACRMLGDKAVAVFKGGGGEAERTPLKAVEVAALSNGFPVTALWPALVPDRHRRLAEAEALDATRLVALWRGEVDDPVAEAIVIGTAAVALATVGRANSPTESERLAARLWRGRRTSALPRLRAAA